MTSHTAAYLFVNQNGSSGDDLTSSALATMAALKNNKKYKPLSAFPISASTSEESDTVMSGVCEGESGVVGDDVEMTHPQIILSQSQLKSLLETSASTNER